MKINEIERAALSVSEFCKAAGIGKTTAAAEIKSGRLLTVKCGARRLVLATELTAWLDRLAGDR